MKGPILPRTHSIESIYSIALPSPKVTHETPKVVDCLDGLHGPTLFTDLEFRSTEDPESVMSTPATYALRATVCPDTSGALSLLGFHHAFHSLTQ